MSPRLLLVATTLSGCLLAGPAEAAKTHTARPAGPDTKEVKAPAPDVSPGAVTVQVGEKDVIRVKTKLRYTTLIVLPKEEQILDFACGDKEFWIINGTQNFAYLKPAKAAAQTNLNLITASGNIYSFVLVEISETPGAEPDLKVFVQPKDQSMISAANGAPRFVSAQTLDDYRQQLQSAKDETRQVKQRRQTDIDEGISRFISNVRFPYRFDAGKKPFFVRAMYHDEKFTYIQARPEETPALYEVIDGKPNLVNFQYRDGVFVIEKILDRGYLAIGKQKLAFSREE